MSLFKKQKHILIITLILIFAAEAISISKPTLYATNHMLTISKLVEPICILQVTDLHNSEFGKNNSKLIVKTRRQNPDVILLTGDLINMNEKDTSVIQTLISDLTSIAPVYISMGNHEVVHEQNFGTDLKEVFEAAGAIVLEREYVDITVNNQDIRIGGIYGYCLPEKFLETEEANPEECAFLSEFQDTDRYTILMCHMPVCWMMNDGLDEWDIDCVFSGHAHGGQIILPFIGGLYAPDMGLFPGELEGIFDSKDGNKHLVLSRGLGSGTWVPRINNRPEIITVEIKPTQEVQ